MYSQIDEAYTCANDMDKLDIIARKLNESKKSDNLSSDFSLSFNSFDNNSNIISTATATTNTESGVLTPSNNTEKQHLFKEDSTIYINDSELKDILLTLLVGLAIIIIFNTLNIKSLHIGST